MLIQLAFCVAITDKRASRVICIESKQVFHTSPAASFLPVLRINVYFLPGVGISEKCEIEIIGMELANTSHLSAVLLL